MCIRDRLVLVNANLPFAGEPSPTLAPANEDGTIQLEAEAADAYRQMSAAAAEDGVALVLSAGYQDADARTAAYEAQKQQYLEKGKTEEEAASLSADIQDVYKRQDQPLRQRTPCCAQRPEGEYEQQPPGTSACPSVRTGTGGAAGIP